MIVSEQIRASHHTSWLAERVARRYLGLVLLVLLVAFLAPFLIERYSPRPDLTTSSYGQMLSYSYGLQGNDADVLLFGGSSALFGIDTKKMSEDLGLKVINLPNTLGALTIVGDLSLRHYLAHNRPPRLIVIYDVPWALDYRTFRVSLTYEGVETLLRYGSWREIATEAARKPMTFLQFPVQYYRVPNALTSPFSRDYPQPPRMVQGHAEVSVLDPLPSSCVLPDFTKIHGVATALDLKREYSTEVTRTTLVVAPVPACQHSIDIVQRPYAALGAIGPVLLPPSEFANDGHYAHALPTSTGEFTRVLEGQVKTVLECTAQCEARAR